MWNNYAKGGLYIKTDGLRIFNSIPERLHQIFKQSNSALLGIIHKVQYINSHDEISDSESRQIILDHREHQLKRNQFSEESEYRLIIDEIALFIRTNIKLNSQIEMTGIEDLKLDIEDNDITLNKKNNKIEGIYLKVDASILISEIGIVGDANLQKIKEKCNQLELKNPIRVISEDYSTSRMENI